MIQKDSYTSAQLTAMVVLRLFIGWHFAYEGLVKILNPKWTSLPYLLDSKGFMSDFFAGLASDPAMMNMVNALNEWALLLIGLGLITGCFQQTLFYRGDDIACILLPFSSFVYRGTIYDAVRRVLSVDRQESGRDGGAGCTAGFSHLSYYRAGPLSEKSDSPIV